MPTARRTRHAILVDKAKVDEGLPSDSNSAFLLPHTQLTAEKEKVNQDNWSSDSNSAEKEIENQDDRSSDVNHREKDCEPGWLVE